MLGNYSLTLVDTLDTLAVMGNQSEFKKAVRLVIDTVSFDKDRKLEMLLAHDYNANILPQILYKFLKQTFEYWVPSSLRIS